MAAILSRERGVKNYGTLESKLLISEILIKIHTFSVRKMHRKLSFAKYGPFCFVLLVLSTCMVVLFCRYSLGQLPLLRCTLPITGHRPAAGFNTPRGIVLRDIEPAGHLVNYHLTALDFIKKLCSIAGKRPTKLETNCYKLYPDIGASLFLASFGQLGILPQPASILYHMIGPVPPVCLTQLGLW